MMPCRAALVVHFPNYSDTERRAMLLNELKGTAAQLLHTANVHLDYGSTDAVDALVRMTEGEPSVGTL